MNKSLPIITILIISTLAIPVSGESASVHTKWADITFDFTDAYYTALDGDNISDDIVVTFDLTVHKTRKYYAFVATEIELPSGAVYQYIFPLKNYKNGVYSGEFAFHNIATEEGWYTFSFLLVIYGGNVDHSYLSFVFDPPGEKKGGDPFAEFNVGG